MIENLLDTVTPDNIDEVAKKAVKNDKESSLDLLKELLVIDLHYQLIRTMTPEGLVTCSGIDGAMNEFYRKCYIQYQHHFSLHDLINEQYESLDRR